MKTAFFLFFTAVFTIRGLDPAKENLYLGRIFKCIDGKGTGIVNDNYCDCLDGSDEPSTNACPRTIFYCPNEGHRPTTMNSYYVDDGVCDSLLCCDGSDELSGCPNVCKQLAQDLAKEAADLEIERQLGSKAKLNLIDLGRKMKADKISESSSLEKELVRLKRGFQLAKSKKDALELEGGMFGPNLSTEKGWMTMLREAFSNGVNQLLGLFDYSKMYVDTAPEATTDPTTSINTEEVSVSSDIPEVIEESSISDNDFSSASESQETPVVVESIVEQEVKEEIDPQLAKGIS